MKRAAVGKILSHGARGWPVRADLDLQKGKTSTDWRVGPSLGPAVRAVPCVGPFGSELSRASSTQPRPVPPPRPFGQEEFVAICDELIALTFARPVPLELPGVKRIEPIVEVRKTLGFSHLCQGSGSHIQNSPTFVVNCAALITHRFMVMNVIDTESVSGVVSDEVRNVLAVPLGDPLKNPRVG